MTYRQWHTFFRVEICIPKPKHVASNAFWLGPVLSIPMRTVAWFGVVNGFVEPSQTSVGIRPSRSKAALGLSPLYHFKTTTCRGRIITSFSVSGTTITPCSFKRVEVTYSSLAASLHVRLSHGHPCARAHCSMSSRPALGALAQVVSSHEQPLHRAH